jgi:tRNA(fMet)-specific endonuclease VapC
MTARYLLDTNTVSYSIHGAPKAVRARMNAVPSSWVAISVFTQAELLFGLAKKPQAKRLRREVEAFLQAFQIFPWDSAAAYAYGELRATQERKGLPLSHEDLMIAAHALALDLTLVTHDAAFAQVDGLRRVDWTVAGAI